MPLSLGDRLGPYEVLAPLGAGGMGDVYRARDTRLGREVAVKTAKTEFTGRFQREARAVAALNHANICTLHDVGPDYLVMELIEGETLAALLRREGRLPVESVLRYGSQIAAALAAAHAKGVTHRDLKPANIMITKAGLKVLDFGLAMIDGRENPDREDGVTKTAALTEPQMVMGTPAYMSPEQLQGLTCDARTDIFALGLVLYEMAAGKRPFSGSNPAAVNAAILRAQPAPLEGVSAYLAHAIERCLDKEPDGRWQSAADVKLQLDFEARGPAAPASVPRPPAPVNTRRWPLAAAVAALSAALSAGITYYFRDIAQPDSSVSPVTSYSGSEVTPAFSPDGSQVAFAWNGENQAGYDIYVKQVGVGEPIRLTKDPAPDLFPKWSPDGKWIAFLRYVDRETTSIHAAPAFGGLERKLADSAVVFANAGGYWGNWYENLDWTPDGKWLVISKRASAGAPVALVLLSFETGEVRPMLPPVTSQFYASASVAPDGSALAYWREPSGLAVQPLNASYQPTGQPRVIALGARKPTFIPSLAWSADSRDILFSVNTRENAAVWRVPASGATPPRQVPSLGDGAANQTVARRGDRMMFSRYDKEFDLWSLRLDESGKAAGAPVRAFNSSKTEINPHFSPDGTKVAFASNRSGNEEIWICLADGSNCSQLTSYGGPQVGTPRWSPDGNWIAFDLFQTESSIQVVSSGGGKPRRVCGGLSPRWSNDGLWIYSWCASESGTCRTPVAGGKPEKILDDISTVEFSPDGAWLYYSGRLGSGARLWRRSVSGGPSEAILDDVSPGQKFSIAKSGIWYLTRNTPEGCQLQFHDFATRATRTVYRFSRGSYSGFALSPDHERLLLSQIERAESHDLVLVEPFR